MEFGGPNDEMVYGNFDQLKVELQQLENVIRKRMIMSGLEEIQLKSMQEQVAQHAEINKNQRKEAMDIIEKLLKTFPTQYNP